MFIAGIESGTGCSHNNRVGADNIIHIVSLSSVH